MNERKRVHFALMKPPTDEWPKQSAPPWSGSSQKESAAHNTLISIVDDLSNVMIKNIDQHVSSIQRQGHALVSVSGALGENADTVVAALDAVNYAGIRDASLILEIYKLRTTINNVPYTNITDSIESKTNTLNRYIFGIGTALIAVRARALTPSPPRKTRTKKPAAASAE